MNTKTVLLAGAASLLTSAANAQTFTEILRDGDVVPGSGGEVITSIDNVDVNNGGEWLVELNASGDQDTDQYVLNNGNVIWRENTDTGFTPPAGFVAGAFVDVMDINDNGDVLLTFPLRPVGTSDNLQFVAVWNGVTVLRGGVTISGAPTLPSGTRYRLIDEVWQNNNGQLLMVGTVLANNQSLAVVMRIDLDGSGNIINETVLALEGETLPGPNHVTPVEQFSEAKGGQAINDNGECIWYVEDESSSPGSTTTDSNLYRTDAALNNTLLYNEGDSFPVDTVEVFSHLSQSDIDLNNNGDFVFSGFDDGDQIDNNWLFRSIGGNLQVLAHEGDPVPASIPGNFVVTGSNFGGRVSISNTGDVLFILSFSGPAESNSALMLNDQVVIQEGVTLLSGAEPLLLPILDNQIAMNDFGTLAIADVTIDPSNPVEAVFLIELEAGLGTPYCGPSVPNSSGAGTFLQAVGSINAADNDVTLVATNMPTNQFGFFVNSVTQGFIANPNNSQGNLCVVGNIGRYNTQSQIFATGSMGSASLVLDLANTPQPAGNVAIMAGETWNFQAWHRDNNPQLTSNFSQGLSILFQ